MTLTELRTALNEMQHEVECRAGRQVHSDEIDIQCGNAEDVGTSFDTVEHRLSDGSTVYDIVIKA